VHLEKIQANDPLLLYYGFEPGCVIKESWTSDITYGQNESFLLVIGETADSGYLNNVLL